MRELGEGIRRMFDLMSASDLVQPKLSSQDGSFSVTLHNKSIFDATQEEWLRVFADANLTSTQKKLIVLGMNGRDIAPNDIYRTLQSRDRALYEDEVRKLREQNILIQIRTNSAAAFFAKQNSIERGAVPRYRIRVPGEPIPETMRTRPELNPSAAVYVGNIAPEATKTQIRELFAEYGSVVQVDLPRDIKSGIPKPYCFVYYKDPREAANAVSCLTGRELFGKRLIVQPYRGGGRAGALLRQHKGS